MGTIIVRHDVIYLLTKKNDMTPQQHHHHQLNKLQTIELF